MLYDMLDEQDVTNRDAKGLPFTVGSDVLFPIEEDGIYTLP